MALLPGLLAGSRPDLGQDPLQEPAWHAVEEAGAKSHGGHVAAGGHRRGDRCHRGTSDAHVLGVGESATVRVAQQSVAATDDTGVRDRHRERPDPVAVEFGGDVAATPPARVGLRAELRFGGRIGAQRVGIVEQASGLRVRGGLAGQLDHRRHGATGHAAGEAACHVVGVDEFAGAVPFGLPVQREHSQIRGNGIEPARVHDPCAGVDGLLVVEVDGLAHEQRLTGQVGVVGAGGRTRGHQRHPVAQIGPYGGDDHAGARRHRGQRGRLFGVGGDQVPGLRLLPQRLPNRQQLVGGSAGERDAGVAAGLGQVLRGELADESGGAVDDDVVVAGVVRLRCAHDCRRYPSVSGGSTSRPSRWRSRNPRTTWYQILVCCGLRTQWFSEGK